MPLPVLSRRWLLAVVLLLPTGPLPAQGLAAARKSMTPADYGRFETFGGDALAPDGVWYAYRLTKSDADGELHFRRTDRDDADRIVPLGDLADLQSRQQVPGVDRRDFDQGT
ncbi:MAG: hypothetical protein IPP98_08700 [Gemmatimonadetes bacterium]|nr:hypothetical protein [Gemmatimonadota bacterium]